MKITKTQLKKIIKEELGRVLGENLDPNVEKIIHRIEGTVDELVEEGRDAEWIFNNLRGSDAIDGLNASDADLKAAIDFLVALGPREPEYYDPQAYL